MFQAIIVTRNSPGRILIRLMIGLIFLFEGIQKLLNPQLSIAEHFQKLGFEDPDFATKALGSIEIICAILILIGFLTRLATIPLFLTICAFLYIAKFPINQGKDFFYQAQELEVDFCLFIGLTYLFLYGAGKWSADRWLTKRKKSFYDPV